MLSAVRQRIPIRPGTLALAASLATWAGLWAGVARSAPESATPLTSTATADQLAFFEKEVRPILQASCVKCHGGEAKIKGGLRLTSRAQLLHGGDSGPAVSLEAPAKSLLLKAINYKDQDLLMPPKQQLAAAQVATLTRWVEMGAPWTPGGPETASVEAHAKKMSPAVDAESMKFWSFQPVARPAVPAVKEQAWVKAPIDNFILSKLEASALRHAAPASKTALLRRAYYDLTGLAPAPQDVDAFVADTSPNAFEAVVDRLLASPQYGEKWGRHWLDVVRYAESNSFERDSAKPNVWRYRDYVIDSFNKDKPYDQFVREQIAGDEFERPTADSITATGFYRLGPWDDEPSDRPQARADDLDDIATTISQGFLGLTVNCARCHDHKIDPIPQRDYYGLIAFFNNITGYETNGPKILTDIVPDGAKDAYEKEVAAAAAHKRDIQGRVDAFEKPAVAALSADERKAFEKVKNRKAALDALILKRTNPDDLNIYQALRRDLEALNKDKAPKFPQALSVKEDNGHYRKTFLLKRGSAANPGDEVTPAFPQVLNPPKVAVPGPPKPDQKTTGLRTQLAKWLASESNPLTARVMANRIWQHHFGRGIVRSPNDFGFNGDRPTHPELLDYLASELVKGGWRLKPLHRQIMLSAAYQMSSAPSEAALAKDPQNDLFWRFDTRRLTAEELRDSMLAVTGKLNLKMGGPSIYPTIPAMILAGQSNPGQGWGKSSPEDAARRSVYIHVKRSLAVPLIESFDGADTDFSCPARFVTTQSLQSLMLMNSDAVNEEAKAFAARLKKEAGDAPADQVKLALRLATSRAPAGDEVDRGVKFMQTFRSKYNLSQDQALTQFALLVLNLNEFVYLD